MSVSEEYLSYVVDQLACLGRVEPRRMFGGVGIYFKDLFFAVIADDCLYFKVDDSNRPDYQAAGMGPFRTYDGKETVMSYFEVPAEVLENRDRLRDWAQKALAAVRTHKITRKRKSNR